MSNTIIAVVILSQMPIMKASGQGLCDNDIPSRPAPYPYLMPQALKSDVAPERCGQGEYLDWFSCKPCPDGTFMTMKMAREGKYLRCSECYKPDEAKFEILVEPCTKTRDAKIMCEDGYYRSHVPGKPCQSECTRCDVCGLGIYMHKSYEKRMCDGDQNTVCCHDEDMVVESGACLTNTTTTEKSETIVVAPEAVIESPTTTPSCMASSITFDRRTHMVLLTFLLLLNSF